MVAFSVINQITETATDSQNGDAEHLVEKVKYPRAIPFIISNEFCERFNYYGMRSEFIDIEALV
jgi:dipeptide/tripeptide permease